MNRNIVIVGSSRSGKTTLAMRINKMFNYNIINLDSIVSGFKNGMPELKITQNLSGGEDTKKLSSFLKAYLHSLNNFNNIQRGLNYVIEGSYIELKDIRQLQKKFIVIVLVSKYRTAKDYYDNLLKYDAEYDWTSQISKQELYEYSKNLKKDNNRIIKFCKANNIEYFDSANNREGVFDIILNKLSKDKNIEETKQIFKQAIHYGSLCINVVGTKMVQETLVRKYEGIFVFDHRYSEAAYTLIFENQKEPKDSRSLNFYFPGFDNTVKYTINNKEKICKIFLDPFLEMGTVKNIVKKFVFGVFIRLFEEKGAILLHAACVEMGKKILVIPAYSNSGKTVTLLNLLGLKYNYISNDLLIVDYADNKLNFLVSPLYIGIRRTSTWLNLPENSMYKNLKSEGYTSIHNNRIYMRPQDLTSINDVGFGNIKGELRMLLSPQYTPNQDFSVIPIEIKELSDLLTNNIHNNFLNNYPPDKNYLNPIYQLKAGFMGGNVKKCIFKTLLNTKAYYVKQNEKNYKDLARFLNKRKMAL